MLTLLSLLNALHSDALNAISEMQRHTTIYLDTANACLLFALLQLFIGLNAVPDAMTAVVIVFYCVAATAFLSITNPTIVKSLALLSKEHPFSFPQQIVYDIITS